MHLFRGNFKVGTGGVFLWFFLKIVLQSGPILRSGNFASLKKKGRILIRPTVLRKERNFS
jgi:hypothetical protein